MKKIMSLLLALLMVLSLTACGSKPEPEKPWVIRRDDYNCGDRYYAFNDYDTGEDYWAKGLIHTDRELETGTLVVVMTTGK